MQARAARRAGRARPRAAPHAVPKPPRHLPRGPTAGLAAGARACRTAADVLARELPSMQLSPVFQHIYGNPNLKVGNLQLSSP